MEEVEMDVVYLVVALVVVVFGLMSMMSIIVKNK
jgi:hypothetical protein